MMMNFLQGHKTCLGLFSLQVRVGTRLKARLSPPAGSCHHTTALRCSALCQGCWKCSSCSVRGCGHPALCQPCHQGFACLQQLQTPGAEGHTLQVLMQPRTRKTFELHQMSINSCFQLLRYKGPNVILNVS